MTTGRIKRCRRGWFVSGFPDTSSAHNRKTDALPETFKELKTRSNLLVSLAIPVHVSHHIPHLTVAAHP